MGIIKERLDELHRDIVISESPPFPKVMLLEPCSTCNLRCSFCNNASSTRKPVMMALSLAEKILADGYSAGARNVGFYLAGEPLLNPKLAAMIKTAKSLGYTYIYISTNGVLATVDRLREMADLGLDSLKFSINSGDRDSYQAIHGRDRFDVVLDNLRDCIELRNASILKRLMISSVFVGKIENSLQRFYQTFSSLVDDYVLYEIGGESEFLTPLGECCLYPYDRINITATGKVTVCCLDHNEDLIVGDAGTTPVREIWYGEIFLAFRRKFLRRELDSTLCGRCLYGCTKPIFPLQH